MNKWRKFKKKPVVIEAVQWFKGDKPLACMQPYASDTTDSNPAYLGFYFIKTLEGNHHVSDGDWIIKGVAGEFYPCKPDIFEKTYEEVD